MPDMEKDFETLRKAVKAKAPKLSDDVILDGITRQPAKRNNRFNLSLAAGALTLVLAVGIGLNNTQHGPLFSLGSGSSGLAETGAAVDSKMAIWANYVYEAGPKLGTSGGSGNVYQLKLSGDPEAIITALAKRFNLEGELTKESYDGNKTYSYFFGVKDNYEKPSLSVYWSGTGSWNLNNYTGATSGPGLPSDDEIRTQAAELFGATGLVIEPSKIDIFKEYGRTAIGHLEVEGKATAIDWAMYWDEFGNLVSASGNSVSVVNRGSFQTVSEKDAVARLSDWRYSGSPAGSYYGGGLVASDMVKSSEPAPAPTTGPDPQPTALPTEPPTINVLCTSAVSAPLMVWDSKGNAWLVPGYIFKVTGMGWQPAVLSLVDGVIELPKADERVVMY